MGVFWKTPPFPPLTYSGQRNWRSFSRTFPPENYPLASNSTFQRFFRVIAGSVQKDIGATKRRHWQKEVVAVMVEERELVRDVVAVAVCVVVGVWLEVSFWRFSPCWMGPAQRKYTPSHESGSGEAAGWVGTNSCSSDVTERPTHPNGQPLIDRGSKMSPPQGHADGFRWGCPPTMEICRK